MKLDKAIEARKNKLVKELSPKNALIFKGSSLVDMDTEYEPLNGITEIINAVRARVYGSELIKAQE